MLEELIEEFHELENKSNLVFERDFDDKEKFCSRYLEELEIIENGLINNHYYKLSYAIECLRSRLLMELIV